MEEREFHMKHFESFDFDNFDFTIEKGLDMILNMIDDTIERDIELALVFSQVGWEY